MFRRKRANPELNLPKVKILIYQDVIESVFDECDRHDINETGGRIIGFYRQSADTLEIKACGLICPGPNARRTSASFFQDGEYQEAIFRKIEAQYPDVEHLGNWHTHHVNGLDTLSTGDIETYSRVVNHGSHNTDFFYALLVVAKNYRSRKSKRYLIKHFLIYRNNPSLYEVPASKVKFIKKSPMHIDKYKPTVSTKEIVSLARKDHLPQLNKVHLEDKKNIFEMYPDVKPFLSKKLGSLYWRGKLDLIDDTSAEVIILECIDENVPSYKITLAGSDADRFQSKQRYENHSFDSARKAIWSFERDLNREIFSRKK